MFTGIILDVGVVQSAEPQAGGMRVEIQTKLDVSAWARGASIACSGACMTVVEKHKNSFVVEVSPESLARTNLRFWKVGTHINLEPSLKLGDPLDGHIVSGHVDGMGIIQAVTPTGNSWHVVLEVPEALSKFVAEKGSLTVDGVSLTVNTIKGNIAELMIIPHTWAHTCFQFYRAGEAVNLEIDILARYMARMMGK